MALAHHLVYLHYDGRTYSGTLQTSLIRFGTACAFVVKTVLAQAIGLAYKQHMWRDMRQRPFQLSSLDALFSILQSPRQILTLEVIRYARISVIVAVVASCLSISGIITPGTLTVTQRGLDTVGVTLASTWPSAAPPTNMYVFDQLGDLIGPGLRVSKVATEALVTGQPVLPQVSPCGENCTFGISFFAPSLNCSILFENVTVMAFIGNERDPPTGTPITADSWPIPVLPEGPAATFFAEPLFDDLTNISSLNIFWTPGATWVPGDVDAGFGFGPANAIKCDVHNASYHVDFIYAFGSVSVVPSVTLLAPILYDFTSDNIINANATAKVISANFEPPPPLLAQFMDQPISFFTGFTTIRGFMNFFSGSIVDQTISSDNPDMITSKTLVHNSKAADSNGFLMYNTSAQAVEAFQDMMTNHTISMLTLSEETQDVPSTAFTTQNVFVYDVRSLWIAYGVTLGCAVMCLLVGVHAARSNGVAADDSFSGIIRARNPTLDEELPALAPGRGPQGDSKRMRLQYGLLKDSAPLSLAFGFPNEVKRI